MMSSQISAERPRAQLTGIELRQAKWFLGQFLSLVAIWSVFVVGPFVNIPLPLVALLFLGGCLTLLFPQLVGRIPRVFHLAATPALIVIIVLDFVVSDQFIDPLIRMLLLLLVYRSIQYRNGREDLQLTLLTLFLLVVSGVMTLSIAFGAQMLLFAPISMAQLFLVNLLGGEAKTPLTQQDWQHFAWGRFLRRLRAGIDLRLLCAAGGVFGLLALVGTLIFISFPRLQFEQAFSWMDFHVQPQSGFQDTITFGDVQGMAQDETIALRIELPDRNILPATPYWRMKVLDVYRDNEFTTSTFTGEDYRPRTGQRYSFNYGDRPLASRFTQTTIPEATFFLAPSISRSLAHMGPFREISFSERTGFKINPELSTVETDRVKSKNFAYSIEDMMLGEVIPATRSEMERLREREPILGQSEDETLRYPETTRELALTGEEIAYLQEIVDEIEDGRDLNARQFASAARAWLVENYRYSLQTDAQLGGEGDQIVVWLQTAQAGWCEYFAGAHTLLCRLAGHPARIVSGFAGASWNDFENYFVIRNKLAHAWVEVYDGDDNWLRFDPTPQLTPGATQTQGGPVARTVQDEEGWGAWLDSLKMVWYQQVISFDEDKQENLARDLQSWTQDVSASLKDKAQGIWADLRSWLTGDWDFSKVRQLVIILIGGVLLFFLIKHLRPRMWRLGTLTRPNRASEYWRRRAGRVLRRFKPVFHEKRSAGAADETWERVYADLLTIRYGTPENQPEAEPVFFEARDLLKRRKREA